MLTRSLRMIAAMTAFAPVALPGLYPGDLPGLYFQADDGAGGGGGGDNGNGGAGGDGGQGGGNGGAAGGQGDDWKAKHDALQAQLQATEAERKRLADAEQARQEAELSEIDREKKRADDAAAEAAKNKQELLKLRIAHELGVGAEAVDLLTGTDEATIRTQAEKIVALGGSGGGQQQQRQQHGTTTRPAGGQQPTPQEQIAAALKGGNDIAAIRLMRQQQGIGK